MEARGHSCFFADLGLHYSDGGIAMFPFVMPSSTMMNVPKPDDHVGCDIQPDDTLNLMTGVCGGVRTTIILIYTSWCYWKMFGRITKNILKATPTLCTKK